MTQSHSKHKQLQKYSIPKSLSKEGDYYISSKDLSKMVLIPEGNFIMGLENEDIFAKAHERPQRTVHLSPYLIDIFPITNEQYMRFINEGGYKERRYWSPEGWQWKIKSKSEKPLTWDRKEWNELTQPVAGVSWYEAEAYAKWADKQLPTEAQWEKAAGGTDNRRYPWGNDFPTSKVTNFNDNIGSTTIVGSYPEGISPFGCYDMSGNVNNWCRDWYWENFYSYCIENNINEDPILDDKLRNKITAELQLKADRGGGFATPQEHWEVLNCTDKVAWQPQEWYPWNGFRTVKELKEKNN